MEKLTKFFQGLLSLSYAESKGFIKLLVVCLLALVIIYAPKHLFQANQKVSAEDARILDSLVNELNRKEVPAQEAELFLFNPNHLAVDSLVLLGLEKDVAQTIENYRTKGGRFHVKGDLKKIYGLSEESYLRISRYIDLPDSLPTTRRIDSGNLGNLNAVTASELESIPMIGRVLAARIVKYRELLGGYVSEDQLYEVYGLSDEAVAKVQNSVFIPKNFRPRLLKVNHDDVEVLKSHPYISDILAGDIVRFREINATIESEKVLENFKSIDKDSFEKLILYLDFR